MRTVRRRSVLRGVAAAAGVSALGAGTASAAGRAPVTHEEHRVVVIGSGFDGGVTALRLAQAGVQVLVLERGLRWRSGPNARMDSVYYPRVAAMLKVKTAPDALVDSRTRSLPPLGTRWVAPRWARSATSKAGCSDTVGCTCSTGR